MQRHFRIKYFGDVNNENIHIKGHHIPWMIDVFVMPSDFIQFKFTALTACLFHHGSECNLLFG